MSEDSFKRYRFSVPKADVSVDNWIKAQSNLSYSLRELIKSHIREHGITDATCIPVECSRGPGRPSNSEQLARAAQAFQQERPTPPAQESAAAMPQSAPVYVQETPPAVSQAAPTVKPVRPEPVVAVQAPSAETPRRQTFVDPMDIMNQL